MNVLIVEDNTDLRGLLQEIIVSERGWKVDTASTSTAPQLLRLNNYDLLIVDHFCFKNPQCLELIKNAKSHILILTSFKTNCERDIDSVPFDRIMSKPFEYDEFNEYLSTLH